MREARSPIVRRLAAGAAIFAAVTLGGPLSASGRGTTLGSDWAQVGANAAHTGVSTDTTIGAAQIGSMTVSQQLEVPSAPAVLPAIAGGTAYIPIGEVSVIHAGGIETMSTAFATTGTGDIGTVYSSPGTVADEPVVDTPNHRLWAVDSTGTLLGFTTGCSAAFPATCSAISQAHVGTCSTSCTASPVLGSGVIAAATSDGNLAVYRANCTGTCAPLWRGSIGSSEASTPTIGNGFLYVGSSTGSVLAFNPECAHHGEMCTPAFHVPSGDTSRNMVAADPDDGIVFWTSADGSLYGSYGCAGGASNPVCGAQIVTPLGAGPVVATPLVDTVDREVIVALPSGVIEAFRIARCAGIASCALTRVWSVTLPLSTASATPSLANGVIWIGDTIGFLHAIAAAGCGSPSCSELALPPGFELAPNAADGMSTEVAAGAVWTASETTLLPGESPTYLLTTVVPG
jgi:hypothetical protein